MRKRTLSRETALKILYQLDVVYKQEQDIHMIIDNFFSEQDIRDEKIKDFAFKLVKGVKDNFDLIDKKISEYATNWELDRMAVVDKNILRIGCLELIFLSDIPIKVAINEAVEMAKKYSGVESGKFVNGILDRIKSERLKPKTTPV
ncbi:MAG: transcription antitermination factor NusB [Candidatus Gygaella obscura]|nr:transcription antitermination factor NusB [Candidatus Gygaella obscura]